MKRKLLFSLLAVFLFATTLIFNSSVSKASFEPTQTARPNIVLILADDLDEATSPYWEAMPKTAALLRDKGMRFTDAFAPTPICCPARSTILTGKYGHNTGILTNGGEFGGWATFRANGNEQKTIAVYLQNAGYKTALIGKYLNGIEQQPTYIPPGWSEWYAFVDNISYTGYNYKMNQNGTIVQYGNADNDYATDVVANRAVDVINRAEADDSRPFFLYVSPTAPHLPLPPARRHENNPYRNALSPRTPNYNEADLSDKSSWLQISGEDRAEQVNTWNDLDYRNRMGSLYALDDLVEKIVNTLQAKGELENTVIVFTSDNGYNLGAHRLIHKMAPYEESIRVPLVIRGPGISPSVERRMALETDFAPTLLELAEVSIPTDMDGRSLVPILRRTFVTNWRSDFLVQYITGGAANGVGAELPPGFFIIGTDQEIPTYRALRTKDYTFIEWYDREQLDRLHEYELYNLRNDPYQLNNLISTPQGKIQYRNLVDQLTNRMNQLSDCAGSNCQ
ncbi:MAG: sulfatase [Blastocatellia bacterium]|nr:sulfatase [Blastocatellia bacterium]